MDEEEEEFDAQQERLWSIERESGRGGIPLIPLAIVLLILGILAVVANDECFGFRLGYALNAPDNAPMSAFRMTCVREAGICSCRQTAGEVLGGKTCVVEEYDEYQPECR